MASLHDLERCSIDRWYPALRACTVKTTLIPLSETVVSYLLADGCFVGADSDGDDSDVPSGSEPDAEWGDEAADGAAGDADARARFPELEAAIAAAIEEQGGACFPKLNWSAPKDAGWVLGGSLKCTSARDVLLLLKSSDNVAHDLSDARRACLSPADAAPLAPPPSPRHVLAIRRWSELREASEFRCFSVGGGAQLLAACQRDRSTSYPFLQEPAQQRRLLGLLAQFGPRRLPQADLPARLVWDAYVDAAGRVYLIDVAPLCEATDPILFQWEQLRALADEAEARGGAAGPAAQPELRVVEPHDGVVPSAQMYYGVPQELRDAGTDQDFASLLQRAQAAAEAGGGAGA